jgi:hypothetical protein
VDAVVLICPANDRTENHIYGWRMIRIVLYEDVGDTVYRRQLRLNLLIPACCFACGIDKPGRCNTYATQYKQTYKNYTCE